MRKKKKILEDLLEAMDEQENLLEHLVSRVEHLPERLLATAACAHGASDSETVRKELTHLRDALAEGESAKKEVSALRDALYEGIFVTGSGDAISGIELIQLVAKSAEGVLDEEVMQMVSSFLFVLKTYQVEREEPS